MPGDDEKGEAAGRGFAGLSAFISDVDAEIAKANAALKQQSVPPRTPKPTVVSSSVRDSSNKEPSHERNQLPPAPRRKKSFHLQWILAISVAIGFIYLLTLESGNNTKPGAVGTPTNVTVPAKSPSGPDMSQNRSLQPIEGPAEQIPPPGRDNVLNAAQIRYCLSESIRLEGAKSVVNSYSAAEVARFNLMIDDLNSGCAEFRYKRGTMESIQLEVNSKRSSLLAEGIRRFQNTQGYKSLSIPGNNYQNDRQYAEDFNTDPDRNNIKPTLIMPQSQMLGSEYESVKRSIYNYYDLVQKKDVDGAMNCYAADKRPQIKKSRIAAVAKDTEYYKIENINVAFTGESNKAKATTLLVHKKYGLKPESWEITLELIKEAGEWKIYATPDHKIN